MADEVEKVAGSETVTDPPKEEVEAKDKEKVEVSDTPEVELEFVVKEGDEYVIRTENSVYKGKTKAEATTNFYNGSSANDKLLKELKLKDAVKMPTRFTKKEEEEIELPPLKSEKEILQEVAPKILNELGVDGKKLSWDNQKWRDYIRQKANDENEDVSIIASEVAEEKALVNKARDLINTKVRERYDDDSIKVAMFEILDDEGEQVKKMVAKSGLPEEVIRDKFNLEEICDRVLSDKSNYRGRLPRSGCIAAEAHVELLKLQREHLKPAMQKKLERDLAAAGEKKKNIPSGGTGVTHRPQAKVYKSMEDALEDAKKQYAGAA